MEEAAEVAKEAKSETRWCVEIHAAYVQGLPLSDPTVRLEIETDIETWASSPASTFAGTSYIGSWITIFLKDLIKLKFKLVEIAPVLALRSVFTVTGNLDLDSIGIDIESSSHGSWMDITLDLDPEGIGLMSSRLDGILQHTASMQLRTHNTADDADADNEMDQEDKPQGLYSSDLVQLHIKIRVRPEQLWVDAGLPMYDSRGSSLELDVTPLGPGLWTYAHGGFMGTAISALLDPKWKEILREQDPGAWKAVVQLALTKQLGGKEPKASLRHTGLMPVLENCPVLCAMGLVRSGYTNPVTAEGGTEPTQQEILPQMKKRELPKVGSATAPPVVQDMTAATTTAERVERYIQTMQSTNRYGYRPLANEWDIWLSPQHPSSIVDATVLHGSVSALVTQTITTAVPGLKTCARQAGMSQILSYGLSPVDWLNSFGHSINLGVHGDKEVPLPLHGPEETCWRVTLSIDNVTDYLQDKWLNVYVRCDVDSDDVVLPVSKTDRSATGEFEKGALTMWPLPHVLEREDLLIEVRGNPKGLSRDKSLGALRLDLQRLVQQHPELLKGEEVQLQGQALGTGQQRRVHVDRGKWDDDDSPSDSTLMESATSFTSTVADKPTTAKISMRIKLEAVGVIDAACNIGVTRAAAQTAVAMLTSPGGLYLDVKSAYSSAYELQLFVSVLKGIGVHCKAVCSFQPHQLKVGSISDTVLFFHGLAGLENACDNNAVPPGQFVLFNGASFLLDMKAGSLEGVPNEMLNQLLTKSPSYPLDPTAIRRYLSLCERNNIVGGIYVQEPDCAPASVDALCYMVNTYADFIPLGFAYGHVNGRAVGLFEMRSRGFASQQIVEEMASRKDLSTKTTVRIENGEHHGASRPTVITWVDRLINTPGRLKRREQKALLTLLHSVDPKELLFIIDAVSGVERLVLKFHAHYELTSPLTLLEAGFNYNYTKSLLRLLRNKGLLAGLSLSQKQALAKYLCQDKMRGWGATWVFMALGIRRGLHKHSKEGLLCLLESCTESEAKDVVSHVGGPRRMRTLLTGWWHLSWHYTERWEAVQQVHATDPNKLAYTDRSLKYAALEDFKPKDSSEVRRALHTRDKTLGESAIRSVRKMSCCAFTTFYTCLLEALTLGTFIPCCVFPRWFGHFLHGSCGMPAVLSMLLGFLFACGVAVFFLFIWEEGEEDVDKAAVDPAAPPIFPDPSSGGF